MTGAANNEAIKALIERVESASGPDREIDGEIDRLLHVRPKHGDYDAGERAFWNVENGYSGLLVRTNGFARGSFCAARYSASIDSAMTLVPRGWIVEIRRYFNSDGEYVSSVTLTNSFTVGRGCEPEEMVCVQSQIVEQREGDDPTPRALVAAALKARGIDQ